MATTTSKSGKGRVAPKGAGHSQTASIDDDPRQHPQLIVGFTTQAMITQNNTDSGSQAANLYQMIV